MSQHSEALAQTCSGCNDATLQNALDNLRDCLGGVFGYRSVGSLDHHANDGLGAGRTDKDTTIAGKIGFSSGDSSGDLSVALKGMLVPHMNVDERLRIMSHHLRSLIDGLARTNDSSKELASGHQAVARGVMLEQDHMARLLAAP